MCHFAQWLCCSVLTWAVRTVLKARVWPSRVSGETCCCNSGAALRSQVLVSQHGIVMVTAEQLFQFGTSVWSSGNMVNVKKTSEPCLPKRSAALQGLLCAQLRGLSGSVIAGRCSEQQWCSYLPAVGWFAGEELGACRSTGPAVASCLSTVLWLT